MFEQGLIKKEKNMFQDEKRKTNYGAICLVCFFCFFFAFQFMKHITTQLPTTSLVSVIDNPFSSDKLSDRREYWSIRPPSTYCLKIESFRKLANSPNMEKYESRPFPSGGYNWTLIVYPKGNKKDGGAGQVSLYVQIDNSTLLNSPKEVYAEVKFFIYNRKEDKYLTYQETDAKRFFLFKPYFGQSRTKSYDEISNPNPDVGYNFDGDTNLFGVDVLVTETFNKWEVLSFNEKMHNRFYTWMLPNFSSLDKQFYISDNFVIGGRSWALKVYPNGDGEAQGNSLSLYVVATDVKPYEKIYLKAKLRVLNQKDSNHVEKKVESWSDQANSWGFQKFVPSADLQDTSKGLLANDALKMEIEFEDFSNTRYFPT